MKTPQGFAHTGGDHPGLRSKSSTACTTALKKKLDTRSIALFLLRIHAILLQTALDRDKLFTAPGQSSSAAEITLPRYLKDVTISRGRP